MAVGEEDLYQEICPYDSRHDLAGQEDTGSTI